MHITFILQILKQSPYKIIKHKMYVRGKGKDAANYRKYPGLKED